MQGMLLRQPKRIKQDYDDGEPHYREMWLAIINILFVLLMCVMWENTVESYSLEKSSSLGIKRSTAEEIKDFPSFWSWYLSVVDSALPTEEDAEHLEQLWFESPAGPDGDFYFKDLMIGKAPHHPPRKRGYGYLQHSLPLVLPIQLTQLRNRIEKRDDDAPLLSFAPTKFSRTAAQYVDTGHWPDPKVAVVKYTSSDRTIEEFEDACNTVIEVEIPENESVALANYSILAKLESVRAFEAGMIGITLTHDSTTVDLLPYLGTGLLPYYTADKLLRTCEKICEATNVLDDCYQSFVKGREYSDGCSQRPCLYSDTPLLGEECTQTCVNSDAFGLTSEEWTCAVQNYMQMYSRSYCSTGGLADTCFQQPAALHGNYYFTDDPNGFEGLTCFATNGVSNSLAQSTDAWDAVILAGGVNNMLPPAPSFQESFGSGTSHGVWTFKMTYKPGVVIPEGDVKGSFCAAGSISAAELKFQSITSNSTTPVPLNSTNENRRAGTVAARRRRTSGQDSSSGGSSGGSGSSGSGSSLQSNPNCVLVDITSIDRKVVEADSSRRRRQYVHKSTPNTIAYRMALPGLYQDKHAVKHDPHHSQKIGYEHVDKFLSGTGWKEACFVQQDWHDPIYLYNEVLPQLPIGLSKVLTCSGNNVPIVPHSEASSIDTDNDTAARNTATKRGPATNGKSQFPEEVTVMIVEQQQYHLACIEVKEQRAERLKSLARMSGLTSDVEALNTIFKCGDAFAEDPRILHVSALGSEDGFATVVDTTQDIEAALTGFINQALHEKTGWLDAQTIAWQVSFFLFCPEADTIVQAKVKFVRDVFGGVTPTVTFNINQLSFYNTAIDYVRLAIELFVVVGTLGSLISEIHDLLQGALKEEGSTCKQHLLQSIQGYISDFWNVVDLVRLVFLLFLIIFRINYMMKCSEAADGIGPGKGEASQQISATKQKLSDIEYFNGNLRVFMGVTFLVFIAWILKYFRHPRLKVFRLTVINAGQSLSHYIFVFLIIFSIYTLMGNVFFGRYIEKFSTYGKSFEACFRILLGDFDYDGMKDAFPAGAVLFFWTFQLFLVLLMLNTIIGIVCAAYDQSKEESEKDGPSPSIYSDFASGISGYITSLSRRASGGPDDQAMQPVETCTPAVTPSSPASPAILDNSSDSGPGSEKDTNDDNALQWNLEEVACAFPRTTQDGAKEEEQDEKETLLSLATSLNGMMAMMKDELHTAKRKLKGKTRDRSPKSSKVSRNERSARKPRNPQERKEQRLTTEAGGNGVEIELLGSSLEFGNGSRDGELTSESAQYSKYMQDVCIVKL